MNTFGLDRNYSQLNFEEISVEELTIVSGGSGGGGYSGFSDAEKAGVGLGGLAVVFGVAAIVSNPVGWGVGAALLVGSGFSGYAVGDGLFG